MQSYFGANVLHPRTTLPVMKYNIPVTIRNVFNVGAAGTKIGRSPEDSNGQEDIQHAANLVKGFATVDNIALVNVEGYLLYLSPSTVASDSYIFFSFFLTCCGGDLEAHCSNV